MHDAVIVQAADAGGDAPEPTLGLLGGQAVGIAVDDGFQAFAGDIFHHHPRLALVVRLHVEQRDQVRVLQVQALLDAADLDVQVALNPLQRHFLAGVRLGEIDIAETANADAALDFVAIEGPGARLVGKLHLSARLGLRLPVDGSLAAQFLICF